MTRQQTLQTHETDSAVCQEYKMQFLLESTSNIIRKVCKASDK